MACLILSSFNSGIADLSFIFGERADKFFVGWEEYIKYEVEKMNRATRFWLAAKFYRMDRRDFELGALMRTNYTPKEICGLLGVNEYIISWIVSDFDAHLSIQEIMLRKNYMLPVEVMKFL